MSSAKIETTAAVLKMDGVERRITWALDTETGSGLPFLEGRLYDENGVHRTTFIRVKGTDSGQRIAADFPTCDPTYVIVDGDGHITNG